MQNSDSEFVTLGLTFGIGFRPTSGRHRRRLPQSGKSSRTEFMNQEAILTIFCYNSFSDSQIIKFDCFRVALSNRISLPATGIPKWPHLQFLNTLVLQKKV